MFVLVRHQDGNFNIMNWDTYEDAHKAMVADIRDVVNEAGDDLRFIICRSDIASVRWNEDNRIDWHIEEV